jgi:hypothetical protein
LPDTGFNNPIELATYNDATRPEVKAGKHSKTSLHKAVEEGNDPKYRASPSKFRAGKMGGLRARMRRNSDPEFPRMPTSRRLPRTSSFLPSPNSPTSNRPWPMAATSRRLRPDELTEEAAAPKSIASTPASTGLFSSVTLAGRRPEADRG